MNYNEGGEADGRIISHRLYKMMDSKCNSLPVASSQPGTLFRGNGSHPLSHLSATFSSQPWALTGQVWSHIIVELGAVLVVTLEVDDLLLPHFGVIKIPITTVKVILQKVKVKMMKKFQGY